MVGDQLRDCPSAVRTLSNVADMILLIQKYLRPVQFLLAGLFGLSLGCLAAAVVGSMLQPPLASGLPEAAKSAAPVREALLTDFEIILQRNIFDSTARGRASLTPVESTPEETATPRETRAELTLLGTVVAGDNSFALVESKSEIRIYHLGEKLPGGGAVETIDRNLMVARHKDGSLEEFPLYEGTPGTKPAAARSLPDKSSKLTPKGSGIREVEENRFVIPAAEVDTARANMGELLRQARLEPRLVDGRTEGFLITMIRPRSLFERLGLKLGDVIMEVNGVTLDSPEKGLQVFQQLREAKNISLSLVRQKERKTLQYQIN